MAHGAPNRLTMRRTSLVPVGVSLALVMVLFASALLLPGGPVAGPPRGATSPSLTTHPRAATPADSVPDLAGGPTFNVNFSELGLPAGALWEIVTTRPTTAFVITTNSTASSLSQAWSNGTYVFSAVAALPNFTSLQLNSSFVVSGGAVTVPVQFLPAFPVRFSEEGIANYTEWTVSVGTNGTTIDRSWAGSTITVLVPAGAYNYSVGAPGYNATPASGTGVSSAPANVSVTFTAVLPPPGYITGDVTVGSAQLYLNGLRTLVQLGGGFFFVLEPGFYSVIITASGYIAYYNETYLSSNETVIMHVALQGVPSPVVPNVSVPGIDTTGWAIIGILSAVAVGLAVATVYFARRTRGPPPASPWTHPLSPPADPATSDSSAPRE
jgi:hypothetical protein